MQISKNSFEASHISLKQNTATLEQNQNQKAQNCDMLLLNIDLMKKIQEMEKQLEFWKDKCLDLKLGLNMQTLQQKENFEIYSNKNQIDQSQRDHQIFKDQAEKNQKDLQQQVESLQKELDQQLQQTKSLKMQIAHKDQQIETFQRQTQKQFDELLELQEKFEQLKEKNEAQLQEKNKIEIQLTELKEENQNLQNSSQTQNFSGDRLSPEQYLEVLCEEKDLTTLYHYYQLVQAKYMNMMSQQYLEQLSKGGQQAPPQTMFPGMGMGMNFGGQFGGMPGAIQMPPQMFQMGGGMTPPQMMNPFQQMNGGQAVNMFGPILPPGSFSNDYTGRQ